MYTPTYIRLHTCPYIYIYVIYIVIHIECCSFLVRGVEPTGGSQSTRSVQVRTNWYKLYCFSYKANASERFSCAQSYTQCNLCVREQGKVSGDFEQAIGLSWHGIRKLAKRVWRLELLVKPIERPFSDTSVEWWMRAVDRRWALCKPIAAAMATIAMVVTTSACFFVRERSYDSKASQCQAPQI